MPSLLRSSRTPPRLPRSTRRPTGAARSHRATPSLAAPTTRGTAPCPAAALPSWPRRTPISSPSFCSGLWTTSSICFTHPPWEPSCPRFTTGRRRRRSTRSTAGTWSACRSWSRSLSTASSATRPSLPRPTLHSSLLPSSTTASTPTPAARRLPAPSSPHRRLFRAPRPRSRPLWRPRRHLRWPRCRSRSRGTCSPQRPRSRPTRRSTRPLWASGATARRTQAAPRRLATLGGFRAHRSSRGLRSFSGRCRRGRTGVTGTRRSLGRSTV
mmetsp:Transcript_23643/g.45920  ORF Transcript_23643/g.45920 Transcript_23643/m.45920 type:complete len:269 (-) Transcript_23643:403-1209(-)